jgi:hypothetical protein
VATYRKLTINFSVGLHDEVNAIARERGITVTELVKRSLALDKFVWENRDAKLLLKDGDEIREVVLL